MNIAGSREANMPIDGENAEGRSHLPDSSTQHLLIASPSLLCTLFMGKPRGSR